MDLIPVEQDEVPEEILARRVQARHRQITIGKSRPEYKLYVSNVPHSRRSKQMPHTPDPHARISKRAFDRELASWRRGLHVCAAEFEPLDKPPVPYLSDIGARVIPSFPALTQKSEDWSPASTESTRADTQAELSPPAGPQSCDYLEASGVSQLYSNVKLNLFEHLSPPSQAQPVPFGGTSPTAASWSGSAPSAMPQMVTSIGSANRAWEFHPASVASGCDSMAMMGPAPFCGTEQNVVREATMCAPPPPASMLVFSDQPCSYSSPPQCGTWMETPPWPHGQHVADETPMVAQPVWCASANEGSLVLQAREEAHTILQDPGSPRRWRSRIDDNPSTPLHRIAQNMGSPVVPCGCVRTPSPYRFSSSADMASPVRQPIANNTVRSQPEMFAQATIMVAVNSYCSEADGYLSVAVGSYVRAMNDNCARGHPNSAWDFYVHCSQENAAGWVPQQILWRCYADQSGRHWASDDVTGSWCWVDELRKNSP